MKNDSCSLEVKQLLSNMAASRQMFRPILCQPQILGNHLRREVQSLQSCSVLCHSTTLFRTKPGVLATLFGWVGRWGKVLGRNRFLRQGWLVTPALVTPLVEGLNFLVSLTFHRAQASLKRPTYPPTPLASSFSSSQSASWVQLYCKQCWVGGSVYWEVLNLDLLI